MENKNKDKTKVVERIRNRITDEHRLKIQKIMLKEDLIRYLENSLPRNPNCVSEQVNNLITQLKEQTIVPKHILKLAGNLALSADLVYSASSINLSERIIKMKQCLDEYDNEIFNL